MKPDKRRLISFCIILIIVLLSCGPGPATTPADIHELETNMAVTLTALSMAGVATQTTPPPVVIPTIKMIVPTVQNALTLPAASDTPGEACDKAAFVSETIPDGSDFAPSAAFTKTWRVRNIGTCTWNTSYAIVFDHGDALSAPATVAFPAVVAPGQEVNLSLNMVAPTTSGTYESFWKFQNASGVIFVTNPFSIKIDVVPLAADVTMISTAGIGIIKTIVPISILKTTQQVFQHESIIAGGTNSASITCPASTIVTGGGFAMGFNMVANTTSMQENGWKTSYKNYSGALEQIETYAICLSNSGGTTSQVFAEASAPSEGIGHAVVACPAGSVVTGGGYASTQALPVYASFKKDNGWQVYAKNISWSGLLLKVYAVCLAGTSATSSQVTGQYSIAGNTFNWASATCPSGSLLTGGGFEGSPDLQIYNTSMTGNSNSWQSYAKNLSGSSNLLKSYAICLTFP